MTCRPDFLQKLYSSSVSQKLETAHNLYEQFYDQLKADERLQSALKDLQQLAEELSAHMTTMNMGEQCGQCAAKEDGGCCSLYMAGETDCVQMLMNLLLGIDVKIVRDDGYECCFLGPTGCIFQCKPMFCLNYNCTHIKENSGDAMLQKLEKLSGRLLRHQYLVEQMILDIICV